MADILVQLFQVDPWSLSLMRVDLAVDVEGVPVPWFRDHAYVNRKQFSSRIEKSHDSEVEFVGMGKPMLKQFMPEKGRTSSALTTSLLNGLSR